MIAIKNRKYVYNGRIYEVLATYSEKILVRDVSSNVTEWVETQEFLHFYKEV